MVINMKNKNNEISISEFKKHCLHLIDDMKNRNIQITITKRKSPVAKVIPIINDERSASFFGCMKGMLTIKGDIVNFTTESEWQANDE